MNTRITEARWTELHHAYGPATDIPTLLERASSDSHSGAKPGSAWFDLWSALCHQGDVYTASYAALPYLIAIARARGALGQYDPLFLAGCIELARMEGRGPPIPPDLDEPYHAAVRDGEVFAQAALAAAQDDDSRTALGAAAAAFGGDAVAARAILDAD
ncbi:MAG: hypothetical protein DMD65_06560 [Gemmatimonadetes bacterium]|nr:MAG: hypothetical protein DMD65_06560 [Gemmatimonadota bacterium]